MKTFNKITTGFVVQVFKQVKGKKFVCTNQTFIAGDDVQFEDLEGNPIEAVEAYEPFTMSLTK